MFDGWTPGVGRFDGGGEQVGQLWREKRYDFSHQSLEPSSVGKLKKGGVIGEKWWHSHSIYLGILTDFIDVYLI